jgi:ribosomal protein S18 acetylase RimI-like enzyme
VSIQIFLAKLSERNELVSLIKSLKKSHSYSTEMIKKFDNLLDIPVYMFKKYLVYKVLENNLLVATLTLKPMKNKFVIEDLFVSPSYQKRGIGKKLMLFSFETAKKLGYCEVVLCSDPNSVLFYEKLGFIKYGDYFSKVIQGRVLPKLKFTF